MVWEGYGQRDANLGILHLSNSWTNLSRTKNHVMCKHEALVFMIIMTTYDNHVCTPHWSERS